MARVTLRLKGRTASPLIRKRKQETPLILGAGDPENRLSDHGKQGQTALWNCLAVTRLASACGATAFA